MDGQALERIGTVIIWRVLKWIGAVLLLLSLVFCWVHKEGHSYNLLFAAGGIDIILVVFHKLRNKFGFSDIDTISQGIQGLTGKVIDYSILGIITVLCFITYKNSGYTWSAEDWMWAKKILPVLQVGLAVHLFVGRY